MTLPSFPSTGKSKAEVLAIMRAAPDQMCKGKRSALSVWCAKAAAGWNLLQRHKFRAEIDRRVVALRRCRNGLILSIDQGKQARIRSMLERKEERATVRAVV
jgi:hypothetical protein